MGNPRLGVFWVAGVISYGFASSVIGASGEEADVASQLKALREEVAQLRAANAQMQALQDEVAQMRAESNKTWLDERRAEEVKGLIREVLSDAELRASLQEDKMFAGHNGKHFFLSSNDMYFSFLMEISGQLQLRYLADFRHNSSDDLESGFEIRRAKMEFAGHVISPRFLYEVQIAINRDNNVIIADKIVFGYEVAENIQLWAGEDKAPFLREEMVSSKRQLAVERSVFNEEFTIDKVQGLAAEITAGEVARVYLMISDGLSSGDSGTRPALTQTTPFNGTSGLTAANRATSKRFDQDGTDLAFTGRVEFMVGKDRGLEDWRRMDDFTSWVDEDLTAFFGAAVHYEVGETGDSFLNNNFMSWTVDAAVEARGFSVFAAAAGYTTDLQRAIPGRPDVSPLGFLVQTAYNFAMGDGHLEPFVRYEWVDYDGTLGTTAAGRDERVAFLTFGSNYYFKKHDAKFTFDVVLALENVPNGHSGLGLSADRPDEDGQVVVRSQFQLLF